MLKEGLLEYMEPLSNKSFVFWLDIKMFLSKMVSLSVQLTICSANLDLKLVLFPCYQGKIFSASIFIISVDPCPFILVSMTLTYFQSHRVLSASTTPRTSYFECP